MLFFLEYLHRRGPCCWDYAAPLRYIEKISIYRNAMVYTIHISMSLFDTGIDISKKGAALLQKPSVCGRCNTFNIPFLFSFALSCQTI